MTRLTKKDYLNMIATVIENSEVENKEELQKFISHELELLAKKSSKTTKTKNQKENEVLVEVLYNELATIGEAVTITELQEKSSELAEYSNQKLSALMKKLVDSGRVTKEVIKKKSYFSVPTEVEEDNSQFLPREVTE